MVDRRPRNHSSFGPEYVTRSFPMSRHRPHLKRSREQSDSSRTGGDFSLRPRSFGPNRPGQWIEGRSLQTGREPHDTLPHRLTEIDLFPRGVPPKSMTDTSHPMVAQCKQRESLLAGAVRGKARRQCQACPGQQSRAKSRNGRRAPRENPPEGGGRTAITRDVRDR